jgi:hypothetical protein
MKYCIAILFLLFLGAGAQAQSVNLPQLINLATLTNDEAHGYLTQGLPFKMLYTQNVDGLKIDEYESGNSKTNKETVTIGKGVKTNSGVFLHTMIYTTTQVRYILSLITQTKRTDLNKIFVGSDATKSIYLYDNVLFTVNFYISIDNSLGTVEIRQKEFMEAEE